MTDSQDPLGMPLRPHRKPVATFSRFAVIPGQLGGLWDSQAIVEVRSDKWKETAQLLALLAHGLTNSLGERGRIAGIRLQVLLEVDHSVAEPTIELCREALKRAGLPASQESIGRPKRF